MRVIYTALIFLTASVWASKPDHVTARFAETWDGGYEIDGEFDAPVTEATAWNVLTDYDDLPHFVTSMKSCRVLQRHPSLLVEQQSEARAWFFHRRARVVLDVHEVPTRLIEFTDVGRIDFKSYAGSWSLETIPGGTRVKYHLEAEGGLGVPRALASGPACRTVSGLLEQVRAEMERRSGHS